MEMGNLGIRKSHTTETDRVKIGREEIANALFYTALFIDILIVIVEKSDYIIQYEGRYFQLTFLLFGLKVLLTKYSNKEWGLIFAFCVLGAVSYFSTGRNEILRLVMMIAASKQISLKKVMQLVFYTTLIGVTILILLSALGIYGVPFMEANFRDQGIEKRYTLGLGHPNALHCMIWAMITLGIYLYLDNMHWYHFVLIGAINIGFYLLTDSKTGVLVTFATILLALVLRYCQKIREGNIIYLMGIVGFIASIVFSVLASVQTFYPSWLEKIDKMVTNRISLVQWYTPSSTWTLFSTPTHEQYMDMGFVRLFDWYGYIPALIFVFVVGCMLYQTYQRKKYREFLVIVAFTLYTVFEAHAISVYLTRNYLLLLLIGNWNEIFRVTDSKERSLWNYFLQGTRKQKQ